MMGQMKMSNSDFKDKAQGTVSLFKNTFSYLDGREDASARKGNYRRSITEIKEDSQDEEDAVRRESALQKGAARARAGASGVRVSSFDDAIASRELDAERKAALIRKRASRDINDLYEEIRSERRQSKSAVRNLALGGLSAVIGMM